MTEWRKRLRIDTVKTLLNSENEAIIYFTKRDLLGEKVTAIDSIWGLAAPQKIIKKQRADGSWEKAEKKKPIYPPNHYSLVATFKQFRTLVEKYGFFKDHPSIPKAAEFLFSCQTPEGDIRGFLANQYATYYTGYILSLLIRAGYEFDPRVKKGMKWLLSMRQDGGGWTVPILTHTWDKATTYKLTSDFMEPVEPDRTKPFSHMATDMVLRAFAAHPVYCKSKEAKAAGALLKSRFFQSDAYTSYQSPRYWTRFAFWWPSLLTALDSLSLLGFTKDDPDIIRGLHWFIDNQEKDGLWKLESGKKINSKDTEEMLWLGLAVCRMLKRYHGGNQYFI
ncbi:MAG: hypothetical protein A2Y90_05470 [Chloroflexi bacterium RBG_13_52_12]|nr:MAG: hypothetical protein A2Y90_05470 [Chloroflexi bacterium RBG_13_52_12]